MKFRNAFITLWKKPNIDIIKEKCNYIVGQKEICPTTNKEHWHLYFEFKEQISMKSITDMLGDKGIKIEHRLGSQDDAIKYCTKIDTRADPPDPYLYGEPKRQGKRSDLDDMVDMIFEGHTSKEILYTHKGNALRHIGFIKQGLISAWDCCPIDMMIKSNRAAGCDKPVISDMTLKNGSEVDGNTGHPLLNQTKARTLAKKIKKLNLCLMVRENLNDMSDE